MARSGTHDFVGFVDSHKPVGEGWCGGEVLGPVEGVARVASERDVRGWVIAIGDNETRRRCVTAIRGQIPNAIFVTIVHPFADVAADAGIGEGSVVLAGVIIGTGARIGAHCILNSGAQLDHECVMGDFSSLAPKVATGGNVNIGAGTAVCIGASIGHGVTIGDDVVIGAGAVVLNDIPDSSLAYGVPARVIRKRQAGEQYL